MPVTKRTLTPEQWRNALRRARKNAEKQYETVRLFYQGADRMKYYWDFDVIFDDGHVEHRSDVFCLTNAVDAVIEDICDNYPADPIKVEYRRKTGGTNT